MSHYREIADARFEEKIARLEEEARKAREYEAAARRGRPLAFVVIAALATVIALAIWGAF